TFAAGAGTNDYYFDSLTGATIALAASGAATVSGSAQVTVSGTGTAENLHIGHNATVDLTALPNATLTAQTSGASIVTVGGVANEYIMGADSTTRFNLGGGSNTVYANALNATFAGSSGNDTFYAGTGNSTFYGGRGNDVFVAGSGAASLVGST